MSTISPKIKSLTAEELSSRLFNINEVLSDLNDRIKILECAAVGYAKGNEDEDIACGFTTHFQDVITILNKIRCGEI